MAKADRLERLDARRADLEAEYRTILMAALEATAAGKWGLFDHRQDRHSRASIAPTIENLCEMGEAIDAMRTDLFLDPFTLHQQFLASRGPVPSNAPGEPKQAQAWLKRLASDA